MMLLQNFKMQGNMSNYIKVTAERSDKYADKTAKKSTDTPRMAITFKWLLN